MCICLFDKLLVSWMHECMWMGGKKAMESVCPSKTQRRTPFGRCVREKLWNSLRKVGPV